MEEDSGYKLRGRESNEKGEVVIFWKKNWKEKQDEDEEKEKGNGSNDFYYGDPTGQSLGFTLVSLCTHWPLDDQTCGLLDG